MESISGIGIDVGTRHLAICLAKVVGMPPPFDPMWISEADDHPIDHVPEDVIPFLEVDFLASIDLKGMNVDDDSVPQVQRDQSEIFMSDELIKHTLAIRDEVFIKKGATIHSDINSAQEGESTCKKGSSMIVPRSGFYESVFSEYTDHEMVVEHLIFKLEQPEFRWIFRRDYPIFIEPQMDQIGDRFKAIMWALTLVLRSSIRCLDAKYGILDSNGDACRIITYSKKKYGLDEAINAIYGKEEYERKTDRQQYDIRKKTVVMVIDAVLWKTGNVTARKFLSEIQKMDDPADALAIYIAAIMTNFKVAGSSDSMLVESFGPVSNHVDVINLKEKLSKFQKKFNGRKKKEQGEKKKAPKRPPAPKGTPPVSKAKRGVKKEGGELNKEKNAPKKSVQKKLNFNNQRKKQHEDNDEYDIRDYQAYDGFDDADELAGILDEPEGRKFVQKEKVKKMGMESGVYAAYVTTLEDY